MGEPWSSAPPPSHQPPQESPWGQPPAPPVAPSTSSKRRPIAAKAGVAALVLTAGVGGFFIGQGTAGGDGGTGGERSSEAEAGRSASTPLEVAYKACAGRDVGDTLSLEDDGATIVIDTGSEYGNPAGMACVLKNLDTPQSITAQMDRTTSLMGVQDAEDNGIEYSWSYHPDNGVNMVITADGGQ